MTTGYKSFGWGGAFWPIFFYSAWEFFFFFFSSSFGRRWVTLLIFVERWFEVERERCLHFELYQTPSTLLPRLFFHAASQFYSSNDKIILIVHSKIIPLKCCLPANT